MSRFRPVLAALAVVLAGPSLRAEEPRVPTYTNDDLARVAPLAGETGVLSVPAFADRPASVPAARAAGPEEPVLQGTAPFGHGTDAPGFVSSGQSNPWQISEGCNAQLFTVPVFSLPCALALGGLRHLPGGMCAKPPGCCVRQRDAPRGDGLGHRNR